MPFRKLESVDAFVYTDLEGAERAVGVVRCAPKILRAGAELLARSLTYRFASLERQVAGASAGVNAKGDEQAGSIESFVAEVRPDAESGALSLDAAKGVPPAALGSLYEVDGRGPLYTEHADSLRALGAATVADAAAGGLDGRTVAIEGFDGAGPALVSAVVERGARVVALSTSEGSTIDMSGLDAEAVVAAWADAGVGLVGSLGRSDGSEALFRTGADVVFAGSKAGVIDHEVAAGMEAVAVVPSGLCPVTAKALAVLRRADTIVMPDFVSTAAPELARSARADATIESVRAEAIAALLAVTGEIVGHEEGPYLGACRRAEAYLGTWQDELPFGRPLA